MARERMITRTFTGNKYEMMVTDIKNAQVITDSFYSDEVQSDKAIKAYNELNAPDFVAVAILKTEKVCKRYGMPESQFIELAQELPLLQAQFDELNR